MKISVIIPVKNARKWIRRQLDILLSQTVRAEIIVVDSGSEDGTLDVLEEYKDRITVGRIPPEEYDHGRTRDQALHGCSGDFVLFLTQDALPLTENYIETLVSVFADEHIAAVYGRQIAWTDAPEYERWTREFNYPETGRIWSKEDISYYGVKSYFFSNCCSAYRRSAYEAVGGFDHPIETNEDMMIAAKFLHAGWKLAYQPQAAVYHSHCLTLKGEYLRNQRIGKVMEQYRDRLKGADSGKEGFRLVRFVGNHLVRDGHPGQFAVFLAHAAARWFGYRSGKHIALQEMKR
ncbi:MAG: glycosyltransferase [Solobacterium sp.]|nr:glycosyltransferase [Solobacterium sp.]